MLRRIYYSLGPSYRLLARRLVFFPIDMIDVLRGKKQPMVPPRGLIYTGSGDFVKTGDYFRDLFIKHGGLKPEHRVLDIGSGIGRMARPLTSYLSDEGSYEGFDLVSTGVKWCKKNISSKYPNFKFRKTTLYNDLYTSGGIKAEKFIFPYKENEFDFVFLISVFTHMLPDEVENYVKEIKRVLKNGGRCFATFFILNETSLNSMKPGKFYFPEDHGHYRLMDKRVQSANVAYNEKYITDELINKNQLKIKKVVYGYWHGAKDAEQISFQDIVVFEK